MADATPIRVRLVSPDRILVDRMVTAVEVSSKSGYLEVLYGHAPLLAELGPGEVRLRGAGSEDGERYSVARGFVEVLPERVTILAESALKPGEIDVVAFRKQLELGHKLWDDAGDDAEQYTHANEVLREAEERLESAKH